MSKVFESELGKRLTILKIRLQHIRLQSGRLHFLSGSAWVYVNHLAFLKIKQYNF